ncbi:MAG: hypothetical protein JNL81_15175 [Hyphomonadaceae bacterium]|nr:hypothetical protein [Hyphomonadaceae bacterium]
MNANAADFGSTALSAFARAAGLLVLAVGAALAFVFAFAAALVVALMIAGAALAMRVWPRRKAAAARGPVVLDAYRTPQGWVVETTAKRK